MSTAGQHIRSAHSSSTTTVVSDKPCQFYGAFSDAAGGCIIYDNASAASGTIIAELKGPGGFNLGGDSVNCKNGITVITTASTATVFFN